MKYKYGGFTQGGMFLNCSKLLWNLQELMKQCSKN